MTRDKGERGNAASGSRCIALPRDFYSRETIDVARELLGKILVRRLRRDVVLEGRIAEVEAYRGTVDPASHAYRGLTERNKPLFGEVGRAYIYFIYGNHYCLNVTAKEKSQRAGGVLFRALEPLAGIDYMLRNRGITQETSSQAIGKRSAPPQLLTNGPGKLTQALQITGGLNGTDMTCNASEIFVREDRHSPDFEIVSTVRIGIKEGRENPWRFYLKGNRFVSRS